MVYLESGLGVAAICNVIGNVIIIMCLNNVGPRSIVYRDNFDHCELARAFQSNSRVKRTLGIGVKREGSLQHMKNK